VLQVLRHMHRRDFLKTVVGAGALAAASGITSPAVCQRAAARTLRFVPQADLANFDPIWNTQYVVRNGAALVWDMLYGVDDKLAPQRQMVEAEELSDDGLTWTFRLRPRLKFHDGEPVLAEDVVASLARWQARPMADLVPVLKKTRNVMVDIADTLGNLGSFRMNHLHPPFNNVYVRRAILTAMSQEDYMRAVVGDNAYWKPLPGFFTPGTPLYTEGGGDILKGPRHLDAARRLLDKSGYAGQPVKCLVAQDLTADLLKHLGMNVDYNAIDWGTNAARRAQKAGCNMFHTWHAGAVCVDPSSYTAIRANGDKAWFGWPTSEKVEAEITAWYEATSFDAEKAAIARLNRAACEDVIYAPTGFFVTHQAWRSNVTGIVKGPLPFFWGVSKT
jgi:ABC-type transport system substrate-binding protein